MAVDRFTRYKALRALWARAKALLAWLHGPRAQDERRRAYWVQVNVAQRYLRDGVIRGPGDPDAVVRSLASGQAEQTWRQQHQAAQDWRTVQEQAHWAQQAQQQGRQSPSSSLHNGRNR